MTFLHRLHFPGFHRNPFHEFFQGVQLLSLKKKKKSVQALKLMEPLRPVLESCSRVRVLLSHFVVLKKGRELLSLFSSFLYLPLHLFPSL